MNNEDNQSDYSYVPAATPPASVNGSEFDNPLENRFNFLESMITALANSNNILNVTVQRQSAEIKTLNERVQRHDDDIQTLGQENNSLRVSPDHENVKIESLEALMKFTLSQAELTSNISDSAAFAHERIGHNTTTCKSVSKTLKAHESEIAGVKGILFKKDQEKAKQEQEKEAQAKAAEAARDTPAARQRGYVKQQMDSAEHRRNHGGR